MSVNLPYNYAHINLETGRCDSCMTFSYEINDPSWISVPDAVSAYVGKYYNINGDQLWYHDELFQNLWEECPSHNV